MSNQGHSRMLALGKVAISGMALAGFLLFTGAPQARADEHECQERLEKADHRLHEAIEHHGYRSRQADHARHELSEERERCWKTYHRWWDQDERRWHSDRDWRDDDHEHYRDNPPR